MRIPESNLLPYLFMFLSSSFVFICSCSEKKHPVPASAMSVLEIKGDDAFSRTSAFYALGPKVSGTEGAAKAVEHIKNEISRCGFTPETDEWKQATPVGNETIFRNISVTIPGEKKEFLIIGAHYDTKKIETVPGFAGANDGASGVGLLLAFLDSLKKAGAKPPLTLKLFFFDGEEAFINYTEKDGLYGSRRAALLLKNSPPALKCKGVIIVDMIGDRNLNISIPSNSDPELSSKVIELAKAFGWEKHFSKGNSAITDDHVPFLEIGIPAVDLIDFEYGENNRYWHTAGDTIDKISPESLQISGTMLLFLVFSIE
ncbi:MAG TPA: hypothetical protein DCZ94_00960 [Lentisphaeria bacterium]|nr:MAG: hypothetical protein A2X48_11810 [Lentisphaerae bacterium GWF2_49_21]HBC85500.1 hypothetical protein [Lentisphaeria bacterium]